MALFAITLFGGRGCWSRRVRSDKTAIGLCGACLVIFFITMIYYFNFVKPLPNLDWASEHSRMPHVEIHGNKVHVKDVRNFRWKTATEYTEGFYDRVYDLDKLESMHYVVATIRGIEAVGHVFLSFRFSDGQHVSLSVEGRRERGVPYQFIASMFRQYQLIYVVGDEQDVLGLRGAIWKKPVYFYPARVTKEQAQAIFLSMIQKAAYLENNPEFYNLLVNNCMTNITRHLRKLGGGPIPRDIQLLLTGFSDRVAHRMGLLDTDLPFEKAREVFRIDQIMQQYELDKNFASRIRTALAERIARARSELKK
ncbi:MAG: DUF4105 domain-containing protein [Deltaproteobacteria bacterium]|nr:DUF4105 domain-containing protein [Deltaproteobacteria bacterium]